MESFYPWFYFLSKELACLTRLILAELLSAGGYKFWYDNIILKEVSNVLSASLSATQTILTQVFRDFFQPFQANSWILSQIRHGRFFPSPLQFIIHPLSYYSTLYTLRCWKRLKYTSSFGSCVCLPIHTPANMRHLLSDRFWWILVLKSSI
jgi:hypothetical protein